ncbi:hypothetical protein NLJ89_g7990 [Agrocybe chaxingu]|uniref:Uncharacterized protein n=1 Tax=Agrocybe chaxingu TaxID=84603 RepID=A0A9W8JVR0_9AGAR|nr:hypothetical protein NLJ89_g7990 [Agrocybe chaxingu]
MSERPRADIEHFRNGKDVEIEQSHIESHQHDPGGSISFGESTSGMKIKGSMLNFSVASPGAYMNTGWGGERNLGGPRAICKLNTWRLQVLPTLRPRLLPGAGHLKDDTGQACPSLHLQITHPHTGPNLNPSSTSPLPLSGNERRRNEAETDSDSEESETNSNHENSDSHESQESESESEQSPRRAAPARTKVIVSKSAPALEPVTNTAPIPVIIEPRKEDDEQDSEFEETSRPVPAVAEKKIDTAAEIVASEPALVVSATPSSAVESQPEAQPIEPTPEQTEMTAAPSPEVALQSPLATAPLAQSGPAPVLPLAATSNTATEPQNVITADHLPSGSSGVAVVAPPLAVSVQPTLPPPTTAPAWTPPTPSPTPPPAQIPSPSMRQTSGSSPGTSQASKGKEKKWMFPWRSAKKTEETHERDGGHKKDDSKKRNRIFSRKKGAQN